MKYPPGMSIVKNSPDDNVSYKGSIIDFINYFADHFKLRYIYYTLKIHYNLNRLILIK